MNHIYSITIDPSVGSTVHDTAMEAIKLLRLGISLIYIIHEGTKYKVEEHNPYLVTEVPKK
jgi:hypothetical protein